MSFYLVPKRELLKAEKAGKDKKRSANLTGVKEEHIRDDMWIYQSNVTKEWYMMTGEVCDKDYLPVIILEEADK